MDSTSIDVESTVDRVLAGDVDAFAGVIEACQESVWRSVAPMLFDRETTRDVVQETFVSAYFALRSYKRGTSFEAWLRTIARNRARNALRGAARSAARLEAYRERLLIEMASGPDPSERNRKEAFAQCREGLPDASRQLVEDHYTQSVPLAEIAKRMGRSVEAVRQALWRLRGALRECIEKRMART